MKLLRFKRLGKRNQSRALFKAGDWIRWSDNGRHTTGLITASWFDVDEFRYEVALLGWEGFTYLRVIKQSHLGPANQRQIAYYKRKAALGTIR